MSLFALNSWKSVGDCVSLIEFKCVRCIMMKCDHRNDDVYVLVCSLYSWGKMQSNVLSGVCEMEVKLDRPYPIIILLIIINPRCICKLYPCPCWFSLVAVRFTFIQTWSERFFYITLTKFYILNIGYIILFEHFCKT